MKILIIKYNAGNIFSVNYALKRLGHEAVISDNPERIRNADRVIFPGVGEAGSAMTYLRERGLDLIISELQQPFLGICLGLQLLCRRSEENEAQCLNIMPVDVVKFPPQDKVPHMGWNSIEYDKSDPLFKGLPERPYFYFVHSFYAETGPNTIARCSYINDFSAGLRRKNFAALQFHPEKSGADGEIILRNFINEN